MGDNQGKAVSKSVSEPEAPQNSNESAKVELTPVEPGPKLDTAEKPPHAVSSASQTKENVLVTPVNAPAIPAKTPATPVNVPATPAKTPATPVNVPATPAKTPSTPVNTGDDLSQLTPEILEALTFDPANKTEQELRVQSVKLQGLLGRVIELLKEKSSVCANLEKQNNALMIQTNSLKDVVAITKDLLSIRNMEVEHLHVDIKSMEEKINCERERHNNMINRMSEAVKLNENLKAEYQSQLQLFTDLRASYEKKVVLLEGENKRLSGLISGSSPTANAPETTEGDVQLTLEAIPPP